MSEVKAEIDYSLEDYINFSLQGSGVGALTEKDLESAVQGYVALKKLKASESTMSAADIPAMSAEDIQALRLQVIDRWESKPWYGLLGDVSAESPKCIVTAREVLSLVKATEAGSFQTRVGEWLEHTFGESKDPLRKSRRAHRFVEEALELAQSIGVTEKDVLQLVDYVFGRPVGQPAQEVGGVMVTLMGAATANGLDVAECAEAELSRVWLKADQIRAKNANQARGGVLPGASPLTHKDGVRFACDFPNCDCSMGAAERCKHPKAETETATVKAGEYMPFRRSQIAELSRWEEGFDMAGVSISEVDAFNGSPKSGDMIARNPANHDDKWLVAAEYFAANFEPSE